MHAGSATTLAGGWFRYDRASGWVLRGLDASFSAGAVHAVVGGNGCGKSTMLSVLAKTVKLQRGHMERGAASAALLPQNPKALLVAETVREELMEWASTCGYDEAMARERATSLGLSGLDGRHPYDLSGGQRQRLALGRALISSPDVLFMDEPFSALDALLRERLQDRVIELRRRHGCTMLLVTHDIAEAVVLASHILILGRKGVMELFENPAYSLERPDRESEDYFRALKHVHAVLRSERGGE